MRPRRPNDGKSQPVCPKSKRGISAYLAAVLLVLFTVVISTMVGAWLSSLSEKEAGEIRNTTKTKLSCQYAYLSISSALFNCSGNCAAGTSHNLTLQLRNSGSVSLNVDSIYVRNATGNMTTLSLNETKVLSAGSVITLENISVSDCTWFNSSARLEKITVNAMNCPEAMDSIPGTNTNFDRC